MIGSVVPHRTTIGRLVAGACPGSSWGRTDDQKDDRRCIGHRKDVRSPATRLRMDRPFAPCRSLKDQGETSGAVHSRGQIRNAYRRSCCEFFFFALRSSPPTTRPSTLIFSRGGFGGRRGEKSGPVDTIQFVSSLRRSWWRWFRCKRCEAASRSASRRLCRRIYDDAPRMFAPAAALDRVPTVRLEPRSISIKNDISVAPLSRISIPFVAPCRRPKEPF